MFDIYMAISKRQRREDKLFGKRFYQLFLGLLIFGCLYYYLFAPTTIGYDIKYTLYILLLPTFIGLVLLILYRRQFLVKTFFENKNLGIRTFMICFYLIQGLIFSYLSFGQLVRLSWDFVNDQAANQNELEIIKCDVTGFSIMKRIDSFDFTFRNRHERFKVPYELIKEYTNKKPSDYAIEIEVRKGLWDSYLVKRWRVVKKQEYR